MWCVQDSEEAGHCTAHSGICTWGPRAVHTLSSLAPPLRVCVSVSVPLQVEIGRWEGEGCHALVMSLKSKSGPQWWVSQSAGTCPSPRPPASWQTLHMYMWHVQQKYTSLTQNSVGGLFILVLELYFIILRGFFKSRSVNIDSKEGSLKKMKLSLVIKNSWSIYWSQ